MQNAMPDPGDFITTREAREILGLNPDQLQRLLKLGRITVLRVPGTFPRLLRSDVERIARESLVPASESA